MAHKRNIIDQAVINAGVRSVERDGLSKKGLQIEDYRAQGKSHLRSLALKSAGVVLAGAAAVTVGVKTAEYAIDHAPTLNRNFDQEHKRNFPNDPNSVSHSAEQLTPAPDVSKMPDMALPPVAPTEVK